MLEAAKRGDEAAPVDLRFLSRPAESNREDQAQVRASVVSYLTTLYHSVAETLPDVCDSLDVVESYVSPVDPYVIELAKQADAVTPPGEVTASRKHQPRKKKKGVLVNQDRLACEDGKEERFLPPGMIKDGPDGPCQDMPLISCPCQCSMKQVKETASSYLMRACFTGILGTVSPDHPRHPGRIISYVLARRLFCSSRLDHEQFDAWINFLCQQIRFG